MQKVSVLNQNQKWFEFLSHVRKLMSQNYQEVQTPSLVVSGAFEAELLSFKTKYIFGQQQWDFELPTSPEFHLKKLLAMGWKNIFEIKTCFRNEEYSKIHRPEFTMLEYYKNDIEFLDFLNEVKALLKSLSSCLQHPAFETKTFCKVSVSELFQKHLAFELSPQSTLTEMKNLCERQNLKTSRSDDFSDMFFRLWLEKIEPKLPQDQVLFVYNYPPSMAALSQVNAQGWAERFEIFWQGLELGNAFHELRDAEILHHRFIQENIKRKHRGWPEHILDKELLQATDQLPQSCGIAIGLERLFMAFSGLDKISDFKALDFTNNDLMQS